jgi:hypothetical protein
MHTAEYQLRMKSGAWTAGSGNQLVGFDLTVEYDGRKLGGTNIQVALHAPSGGFPHGEDCAIWLASGWGVVLRNQFARAPAVATAVIEAIAAELSDITRAANSATGTATSALSERLRTTTFRATGPAYWP